MSNRKDGGDTEEYLFTGELNEPDPSDFVRVPIDLSSVTLDNLDDMALQLLSYSYDYCQVFVPTQLSHIKKNISIANKRLANARSADDYVKIASASRTLTESYSGLLEQATVMFMSSYRPLHTLIQTNQLRNSSIEETATKELEDPKIVSEEIENSETLDSQALDDLYRPYIDD